MRVSGGEGFGPEGPSAGSLPPFSISGPVQLTLDDTTRAGAASFTVSNVTGRPVRARLLVQPGAGADASWFQIAGDSERPIPVAGTATVDVSVTVAKPAPAGAASFALGAALEEAPDQVVTGPTVAFTIPAPQKPKFRWWIILVIVAALIVLAGGGFGIWALTRPGEPEPTSSPTDDGAPVFLSGEFTAEPNSYFDLDTGTVIATSGSGEDVYFYPGAGSGELGVVGQGPPRLAVVDEPTFAACEAATGYDDIDAQNVVLLPDRETYVCVRFTDQARLAVMTVGPAEGTGLHVAFTTWERG